MIYDGLISQHLMYCQEINNHSTGLLWWQRHSPSGHIHWKSYVTISSKNWAHSIKQNNTNTWEVIARATHTQQDCGHPSSLLCKHFDNLSWFCWWWLTSDFNKSILSACEPLEVWSSFTGAISSLDTSAKVYDIYMDYTSLIFRWRKYHFPGVTYPLSGRMTQNQVFLWVLISFIRTRQHKHFEALEQHTFKLY